MLRAENKPGEVRETENQLKWHRNQINKQNLEILIRKFNKLDKSKTTLDKHIKRKKTITVHKRDIYRLLNKDIMDLIMEYNETYLPGDKIWDKRIIIRDNDTLETDKGKQNLCIVFSLTNNKIITAYYNKPDDKHETINMNRYCSFALKLSF